METLCGSIALSVSFLWLAAWGLYLAGAGAAARHTRTAAFPGSPFAFLNLLPWFPCCLALPLLARSRRFGVLPLAALFATSPIVMQNATYTWTKLLTVFFAVLATALYLKGWRRNSGIRIVFAFQCL